MNSSLSICLVRILISYQTFQKFFQIRRAINSSRTALITDFVPLNFGFQHITLEYVIQGHVRQIAKDFTIWLKSDPYSVPWFSNVATKGVATLEKQGPDRGSDFNQIRDSMTSRVTEDPAILVLAGTYVYIQKRSLTFFARRSYSLHNYRPILKPVMVVTTGYSFFILGPYWLD